MAASARNGSGPEFFIVGAPKCGTTSMAAWLTRHPEVHVIRGEPHFFGRDLDYNQPRLSRRQYRALVAADSGKPVRGDRSTWYLYSRRAAAEIHAWNADARIIAMLRNPAEMVYSLHAHHYQRGERDDLADLADALAAEPERRAGRRIPPNARFDESLFYSEVPRYHEQLLRYIKHFGRERVHVILLDDMRRDARACYRDVLEFLSVDPEFEPEFEVQNRSAPTPDSAMYRVWKASTLRYRLRSLVPQALYEQLRARRHKKLARAAREQPRPPFDPELKARLTAKFAPEVRRLEDLLDRDLSAWRGA